VAVASSSAHAGNHLNKIGRDVPSGDFWPSGSRKQIDINKSTKQNHMIVIPMFAAAGYSLIYLLLGGGLGGEARA
jgi:hypothetical protein